VYASIPEIPDKIDLGIIMINARSVAGVMQTLSEKGVKAVVVVSDGFAERDAEGARHQAALVASAGRLGVRIIGPNTAGVANTANGFNPCPYEAGYYRIKKGPTAICAQTGMINPQAFPYGERRFGVSKICDFGNKCDVDECDMMTYLGKDPDTQVICMYLESIRDGKRFLTISSRVALEKPVLILKSGKTQEGAKASVSHSGGMAVDDKVFEAACRQAGILRLNEFRDPYEVPKIFAAQPLPGGNRLGIMTFTGGVAVQAIDEAAKFDLATTSLHPETAEMLDNIFPGFGKIPVDLGPVMAAVKDAFDRYPEVLSRVLADPNIDALFNVLWANPSGNIVKRYIEAYEALKGAKSKPLVSWIYGPNAGLASELAGRLEDMGFPVFRSPESAIKALGLAWRYAQWKGRMHDEGPV
jgi:acyl-CoA synthetase (NDP forming)